VTYSLQWLSNLSRCWGVLRMYRMQLYSCALFPPLSKPLNFLLWCTTADWEQQWCTVLPEEERYHHQVDDVTETANPTLPGIEG